ncbi:hypothetical protein SAMN02745181_1035 [Rubritalea squalenifaciens DSM 18772]|uniref:Polysaccharide pyruvyl transferase n=1 Tax=Rubritalea squalenifaciens DSM 18772 TaxID=1123071 RepID=A0A1M6EI32_9BACT|nr:polysaccharide pyruvyl transferase family protein [Rubritalea squalenifaciens]SHI85144.1 hypothetical protein SAMN02745181_1035 [Rubritalea squalenifaciens DSM 18772]
MKIYNVFRRDESNAGDWYSPAFRYFPFLGQETLDIACDPAPEEPAILIFGGGGLISPGGSFKDIHRFFNDRHHCIGWGVGENWTINMDDGFYPKQPLHYPEWLSNFKLLGLRDFCNPYEHVPCASCFHEAFDQDYEVQHEVGIYQHKRMHLPKKGFPALSNNGADMNEKIAFIGSCETIVTNSYHGIYWALLLGKKVISVPFASKFYGISPDLTHCPPWDIDIDAAQAPEDPKAYLRECRDLNKQFGKKVESYISQLNQ